MIKLTLVDYRDTIWIKGSAIMVMERIKDWREPQSEKKITRINLFGAMHTVEETPEDIIKLIEGY